jgi:hypothetical protein
MYRDRHEYEKPVESPFPPKMDLMEFIKLFAIPVGLLDGAPMQSRAIAEISRAIFECNFDRKKI